jgi:hypothetical protein
MRLMMETPAQKLIGSSQKYLKNYFPITEADK